MNENINLVNILRDCPIGTELYSSVFGKVTFLCIDNLNSVYPIKVKVGFRTNQLKQFTERGTYFSEVGECILFPSENQRDWNKFTAPWLKKEKFDPKTLKEFDKVLVRDVVDEKWHCDFFSHLDDESLDYPYTTVTANWAFCIPYNDETKHLVGSKDEEPGFYRYYEED